MLLITNVFREARNRIGAHWIEDPAGLNCLRRVNTFLIQSRPTHDGHRADGNPVGADRARAGSTRPDSAIIVRVRACITVRLETRPSRPIRIKNPFELSIVTLFSHVLCRFSRLLLVFQEE